VRAALRYHGPTIHPARLCGNSVVVACQGDALVTARWEGKGELRAMRRGVGTPLGHGEGEPPESLERALRDAGEGTADLDGADGEGQAGAGGLGREHDGDGAAQAVGAGGANGAEHGGRHGAAGGDEEGGGGVVPAVQAVRGQPAGRGRAAARRVGLSLRS